MTGTVERVRGKGAFCFLKTEEGNELFAHKTSFMDPTVMKEGAKVTFDQVPNLKGMVAVNVMSYRG